MSRLHFYASIPEPCSYLPNQESVSAFANPNMDMDMATYDMLIQKGFRRSGGYVYRPHCGQCQACQSLRVLVDDFKPGRNARRLMRRNADLSIQCRPQRFSEEHFQLYSRYINTRHGDGAMAHPSRSDYSRFLINDWSQTEFVEFRMLDKLVAVSVMDLTATGLSAVYTFFDPDQEPRSLGRFAILWQIEESRQRELPYLYLGYWVAGCRKMEYKIQYQPAQIYVREHWQDC